MKPILFSTPMVQAILEGRKTMTRRIVKNIPYHLHYDKPIMDWHLSSGPVLNDGRWHIRIQNSVDSWTSQEVKCKYNIGDILWVRETFIRGMEMDDGSFVIKNDDYVEKIWYKADNDLNEWMDENGEMDEKIPWKPSIHMPYTACRIWLKIKSLRVERLQDISTEDILSEGVRYGVSPKENNMASPVFKLCDNSALSFMPDGWEQLPEMEIHAALLKAHWFELWCAINGRESWDANPWVWVVEFERTEKP